MTARALPLAVAGPAALDEACGSAIQLQLEGKTDLAERAYRSILETDPAHARANHCLGMLHVQLRRAPEGVPFLLTALNAQPEVPDYWLGYLEALLLTGQEQAAAEALALGRQHGLAGRPVEEFARRLDASALSNAAAPVPNGVTQAPAVPRHKLPGAASNRRARNEIRRFDALMAMIARGRHAEALILARQMTEAFPRHGLAWKTFGALLWWTGNHAAALPPMQRAAELLPGDAETHSNLGMALLHLRRVDAAVTSFERAIRLDGRFAAAHYHLGMARFGHERYAEALTSLATAVRLDPGYLTAEVEPCHSILIFLYAHDAATNADVLFAEHCSFGRLLEEPLAAVRAQHAHRADPERRLRVGLVSGDLRNHAVASFLEPVLEHLNGCAGLELHAYYNETAEDRTTALLRTYFKSWNPIAALADAALADLIRSHQIDILFDLSGPTGLNRLRAFARKPAPIQVSWLGYPGTTGMRTMDYHLADRHWLPAEEFDRQFVEQLVYLPASALFRPDPAAPAVNPLPALAAGHMTFGSFNRLGKINLATIGLWSQLLRALPDSRLILAGIPLQGHTPLIERFAAQGVARDRLTLHPRGSMQSYLALHGEVDLCLDTFPYNGGTTTHHALWMGVPTLTMSGTTPAGRQGAGILGLAGLKEFIAADAAEFVAKGLHWATRPTALAQLRAGLRERCRHSPSQRPQELVAALDQALRHMWRTWCAGLPPQSFEIAAAPDDALLLSLIEQRRFEEARAQAALMTERFPEHGLGWKILGAMHWTEGHGEEAAIAMRNAARLLPGDAETHSNLGMVLAKMKHFNEADACLRKAIEIDPTFAAARYRQGMSYELQGRYAEAEVSLRAAIALRSGPLTADDEQGYSNLLYIQSYNPSLDAQALFLEHRRVGEIFEAGLKAHWPPHRNGRDTDRRLQVGFVSGDLRNHALASFLEPVLSHLCRDAGLHLHAYSNSALEDEVSARLKGYVQHWHPVARLPDAVLAQQIVGDGIDVLIDLSGHTGMNRLRTFACKPAPVQASWMGYPGTTGLTAMDYFLTDRYWLPRDAFDRQFVEKLVYLPASASFRPEAAAPAVNDLPALAAGHVTFGSFNRLCKINAANIRVWSQLLRALPTAALILAGIDPEGQQDLVRRFADEGIESKRLSVYPRIPMDQYLALHHRVDLCLDTFPYGGATTTHHALWMGVPTLTIAGATSAGRQGAGILGLAGLDGFIAADPDDFIAKGIGWETRLADLAALRSGLRDRCRRSPSQRPDLIADGLARALRHMWARWCAGLPAESFEIASDPNMEIRTWHAS